MYLCIYVFMGWMVAIAIRPLMNTLDEIGLGWQMAGGFAYAEDAIITQLTRLSLIMRYFIFLLYWVVFASL